MLRLLRGLFFLILILLLLLLAGFIYLRFSLPTLNGTLKLVGLKNSVEVIRDRNAIPHIYASSKEDAYFALGFVHAQDRLWQMEFQRRVGAGRLSEIVGDAALDTDKFLRTLSVYHYAQVAIANMDPQSQQALSLIVLASIVIYKLTKGHCPLSF